MPVILGDVETRLQLSLPVRRGDVVNPKVWCFRLGNHQGVLTHEVVVVQPV
jgi:hypothetical protein